VREAPRGTRRGRTTVYLKLLTPFLVLLLLGGLLSAFLIVRDLSSRAETVLENELSRRSLEARSVFQDQELYLLESANLAANLEGMAGAARNRRRDSVADLLRSVLALKTDIGLLTVTDLKGGTLSGWLRTKTAEPVVRNDLEWRGASFVKRTLAEGSGRQRSGLALVERRWTLAVAAPICSEVRNCRPVGVAIAGIDLRKLVGEAAGRLRATAEDLSTDVGVFDDNGRLLSSSGRIPRDLPAEVSAGASVRGTTRSNGEDIALLYTPLQAGAIRIGTLAIAVPTAPAFVTAREAGIRLASVMLVVMALVLVIGTLLSRSVLRQVRPLVETNRRLGSGDLSARAPVLSRDELGELAEGVNDMAEQLQADHETMEMRVAERTQEIRRLLHERTELFAAISHEFRTPLAVIMGEVDMLLDPAYGRGAKKAAELGPRIKESAAQLLGMVNDILELAKAETGALEVDLRDVDLGASLEEMRPTIEGLARAAELEVTIDSPVGRVARADPLRLREIILNLVDNAVKYTPPGGTVTVSAASRSGVVEVSVSDTGVGIPADAHKRIFEPFFRVKATRPQRGQPSTGLGLALTKRLVEAHGGAIRFDSKPGEGTTFSFTLKLSSRRRSGGIQNSGRRATASSQRPRHP